MEALPHLYLYLLPGDAAHSHEVHWCVQAGWLAGEQRARPSRRRRLGGIDRLRLLSLAAPELLPAACCCSARSCRGGWLHDLHAATLLAPKRSKHG